jgi:hypothetical protein
MTVVGVIRWIETIFYIVKKEFCFYMSDIFLKENLLNLSMLLFDVSKYLGKEM